MDKQLSKKDQKALLNVAQRAREARMKMEAQEEIKRWSVIDHPNSLEDHLSGLPKHELSLIRTKLNIYGASTLKKQDLVAVLRDQIPILLPNIMTQFDETRYGIMKQIASKGGSASLPLETHQLEYFKAFGLIFTGTIKGKRTLVMPHEVLEQFNALPYSSIREVIQRNTEWITLTQGLLHYYGTLTLAQLETFINTYRSGTDVRLKDYLEVIFEARKFYGIIRSDDSGSFSNYRVWDPKKIMNEHLSRPDLSYYPFTKNQLMLAGVPDFVDRNPSYRSLVSFIKQNYEIEHDLADGLVEECVYAIQIGELPGNIMTFLQQQLEIDDLDLMKSFVDHIVILHNHTKQWSIKGYAPNELSALKNRNGNAAPALANIKADVVDFATRKKVGRNDPCPCGSGKKFKKCCGD